MIKTNVLEQIYLDDVQSFLHLILSDLSNPWIHNPYRFNHRFNLSNQRLGHARNTSLSHFSLH